jgi:hypothetical protein
MCVTCISICLRLVPTTVVGGMCGMFLASCHGREHCGQCVQYWDRGSSGTSPPFFARGEQGSRSDSETESLYLKLYTLLIRTSWLGMSPQEPHFTLAPIRYIETVQAHNIQGIEKEMSCPRGMGVLRAQIDTSQRISATALRTTTVYQTCHGSRRCMLHGCWLLAGLRTAGTALPD